MDTFFPPLPACEAPATPSAQPNYQVELWQRRFSGMFKSSDDAIWVWTALALLFGLIAILYFRLKTIDL
ncbi:MAG: hypothetical protein IPM36_00595 [Lewinellaceae bacterium]|nr:hypothetical protein [Lewinellaceae bacterium]